MIAAITVLAPVLGRPQNAAPLAASLRASTSRAELIFICSPGDDAQITACIEVSEPDFCDVWTAAWPQGPGDYARKINWAYRERGLDMDGVPQLVLLGADDISFQTGWLEAVEAVAAEYDVGVIGTDDGANPAVVAGLHSTHPVVRRGYIDRYGGVVGMPGTVYSTSYHHQYVETELIQTAMARGCYYHCHAAHVPARHPLWRTAPDDATYALGRERYREDARLYESRKRLWLEEAHA